jgi:hypothetical protein
VERRGEAEDERRAASSWDAEGGQYPKNATQEGGGTKCTP